MPGKNDRPIKIYIQKGKNSRMGWYWSFRRAFGFDLQRLWRCWSDFVRLGRSWTRSTVKKDGELAKYDILGELKLANKSISQLFDNQQAFANAKRKDTGGVGQTTILKFLGGNWKQWMVQEALETIRDDEC